jgi:uncharacterized damage-inducible protein DinB
MDTDIPLQGQEKPTLVAFLNFLRAQVIVKVEDLDRDAATRQLVPSATTLASLVKHLTDVERWWFRIVLLGEDVALVSTREDPDADWRIEADDTVADLVAAYRAEVERANAIVEAADLDGLAVKETRGDHVSLRWILVHMIEETARHAGHADILREQIDGAAGVGY